MNSRDTFIWDETKVLPKKWSDIKVGDIVKVEKDQEVPADLLLI